MPVGRLRPISRAATSANALLVSRVPFLEEEIAAWHFDEWGKLISLPWNVSASTPSKFQWQRPANWCSDKSPDGERWHDDGPDQGQNLFWYGTLVTFTPCLVDEILYILEEQKNKAKAYLRSNSDSVLHDLCVIKTECDSSGFCFLRKNLFYNISPKKCPLR